MLVVETIAKIRRAYFAQNKPIKTICREFRVSRRVVRKVIRSQATEFRYERSRQPRPRIDPWRDQFEGLLLANAGKPAREQLTLIRIFEELRAIGYEGSYDAVRRYAKRWRAERGAATAEAFVPLSFAIDWELLLRAVRKLPPRELRPNFLRMDARIHPGNEKVIEHVGALGDEAGMISRHRFDQAFDEFFAELLNHLGSAPRKESRGMARTGICAFPAVDDCPEPIEHVGTRNSSKNTGFQHGNIRLVLTDCSVRRR